MALPEPEAGELEELWRRAVLAEFVRRGWLEAEAAAGMLSWPHSGFGAYPGPRIEARAGLLRVARYPARAPVAEGRLRYDAERRGACIESVPAGLCSAGGRLRPAPLLRMSSTPSDRGPKTQG